MKHIGNEIDNLITKKRLKTKDIASRSGITATYLTNIKKKSSIDAELLCKIANAIGVKVGYFFDEVDLDGAMIVNSNVHSPNSSVNNVNIEALMQLLIEKERTIQLLIQQK